MMPTATLTEMIERSVSELLKGIGTSVPGHVLSFDPETQFAKVQVGVEFVKADGNTFKIAPIINVPVHFTGGEYSIEHQIDNGNEGLILIAQRCIDGWKEQGGVASQPVLRKLDMQDALFIPGFRSKPGALSSFQNNGVRLRNGDGSQYIWLKNDNTADITVPTLYINGNIIHTGNVEQTGNLDQTGNTTISGTMTAGTVAAVTSLTVNGVEVKDHDHTPGTYTAGATAVTGNSGALS